MTNQGKYNIFILLSTFGRGLIETFPPLILYKYNVGIKGIILYFLLRYLFAIPINCLFVKLTKIWGSKIMIIISSIMIGITYYDLYNMGNTIYDIALLSLLTSTYIYSYWTVRNFYMLQVIEKNKVTSNMSSITIINILGLMPSIYIGAYILEKYSLLLLIIVVFIINILSIIPLLFIKLKSTTNNGLHEIKYIPLSSKLIMCFDQFKTIILSLFPLYVYIYINKNYTYLGIFNIIIGIASILVIYIFSKVIRIKHKSYFSFTVIGLSICFFIKLLVKDQYIFLSLAILEGLFTKMEELSFGSNVYNLGKNFDYMYYILVTENIFNLSRLLISIPLLFIENLNHILIFCIIGFLITSFFKFDINIKK